ncbi:MAG: stage V sporulation protein AC [Eubacterium sp.]|nr:stage V sporulation protein AC [Eubacterium sp.]
MLDQTKTDIREVIHEPSPQKREEIYNEYVKENTPKKSWFINLCKAFVIGGLICDLGQLLTDLYIKTGMSKDTASLYTTLSLIFLSILFTGFNLYQKLANFAGAGTLVPITGFANSVAAPAIEFKKEGQVFGIGCKIFTIAGPVILYGVFCSWVLGMLYWIGKLMGWVS